METTNPQRIHVLSDKYISSPKSLSDECDQMEPCRLDHAMKNQWDSDAHFVGYDIDGEEYLPRLNKQLLNDIRDAGKDVSISTIALDYDLSNPDTGSKRRWESPDEVDSTMSGFIAACPVKPTFCYSTLHGLRAVFALSKSITPEYAEDLLKALHDHMNQTEFPCDDACKDWTRLYRLPQVIRDRSPTWNDETFVICESIDSMLDPESLADLKRCHSKQSLITTPAKSSDGDRFKPDDESAQNLLSVLNPSTGRPNDTAAYKLAKKRLKNLECFSCVSVGTPIAQPGSRNTDIQRLVGQAISWLYGTDGVTPELIYALFQKSVQSLEPDSDTPDWSEVLWKAVLKYWAAEGRKRESRTNARNEILTKVATGMAVWNPATELINPESEEAWQYVRSHIIALGRNECFVLQDTGRYSSRGVSKDQLWISSSGSIKIAINGLKEPGYSSKGTCRKVKSNASLFLHQSAP